MTLRMDIPGSRFKDVVMLSTADWDHAFWTNKQPMARELARHGLRVLYVESIGLRQPTIRKTDILRIGRRFVKGMKPLRRVEENIWVYSPLVLPLHRRPWIRRCNRFLLARAVQGIARWLRFQRPILWTYQPFIDGIREAVDASMLVYHCVDDLAAAPRMPGGMIRQAEHDLLQKADVVFVTSRALLQKCARWNDAASYFPNVVDYDHFAQARLQGQVPADLAAIPGPRIGFIGAISSYKLDMDLIAHLARQRRDWQWVLLGQVGEGQPDVSVECLQQPNIHLLGPRPYRQLPDYLRGIDVAVIPCPANAYTAAMFPMKFFEYLAAGKPVVTMNTPALNEFGRACILTESPEAFVQGIQTALDGNGPDRTVGIELSRFHTWHWRTQQMLKVLERMSHPLQSRYGRTG